VHVEPRQDDADGAITKDLAKKGLATSWPSTNRQGGAKSVERRAITISHGAREYSSENSTTRTSISRSTPTTSRTYHRRGAEWTAHPCWCSAADGPMPRRASIPKPARPHVCVPTWWGSCPVDIAARRSCWTSLSWTRELAGPPTTFRATTSDHPRLGKLRLRALESG